MIAFDKKFFFMHISKSAGATIKQTFLRKLPDVAVQYIPQTGDYHKVHMTYKEAKEIIENHGYDIDEFYKFCVVRNPWDRVVSWYYHWWTYEMDKHGYTKGDMDTFDFNSWVAKYGIRINYNDIEHMNYVIRFENLQNDLDKVLQHFNLPTFELHKNDHTTNRPKRDYTTYYNDESKQLVAEKYSKIIDDFGYKFGE